MLSSSSATVDFMVATNRAHIVQNFLAQQPEVAKVEFPIMQPSVKCGLSSLNMRFKNPGNPEEIARITGVLRQLGANGANKLRCALV